MESLLDEFELEEEGEVLVYRRETDVPLPPTDDNERQTKPATAAAFRDGDVLYLARPVSILGWSVWRYELDGEGWSPDVRKERRIDGQTAKRRARELAVGPGQ